MTPSKPLIVTGMPRSGIGLASVALFNAGLYLGGRLNPPRDSQWSSLDSRESDVDMSTLHDEIFGKKTLLEMTAEGQLRPAMPHDLETKARQIIQSVYAGRPAWGWRDARTALLLNDWQRMLPDARWIFVIRPPAETVWSMLWHHDLNAHIALPAPRALEALSLWAAFNQLLLTFAQAHPDRVHLLFTPQDMNDRAAVALNETLLQRWRLDLRPVNWTGTYYPHFLKRSSPAWIKRLAMLHASSRRVWDVLLDLKQQQTARETTDRRAHLEIDRSPLTDASTRHAVCIVAAKKLAVPETFVRDHVHRLPARVEFVHGEDFPTLTSDDLPLRSRWERFAEAHFREFGVEARWPRQRAFIRFLRRKGIEVVLAEFGPVGVMVMDACMTAGVPLVVHFHGYDASRQGVLDKHRLGYQQMFGMAAGVVAVSRDMEQRLLDLGAPRERLFCNPCGVDTSLFCGARPNAVPPHFLSVGRFVEKKGPHLTLLAFQQVAKTHADVRLTMIGDGLLRGACEQMIEAMRLRDRVTILGARPHQEVAAAMRSARCFVQHSLAGTDGNAEGTPVSISEAGASGLPVISTRHAGIKDSVIHGRTGFLVEEGDVEAMASHMIQMAEHPELAAQMGAQAREHICAHYSMEKSIGGLWQILERAIHERART